MLGESHQSMDCMAERSASSWLAAALASADLAFSYSSLLRQRSNRAVLHNMLYKLRFRQ